MTFRSIVKKPLICFTLALIILLSQALTLSFAEPAPPVDPETTRFYSYAGEPGIGLWLNRYDNNDKCIGNVYVVFNAGSSFNQFGIPVLWAGSKDNGTDASLKVGIFEYNGSAEESIKTTPLFTETVRQNGNNSFGAIFPMGMVLPAGKYVLMCSQISYRRDNAEPYLVIPTGTPFRSSDFLEFGGTAAGVMCFFIDFIKDENVQNYILPLTLDKAAIVEPDPPVVLFNSAGSNARKLNDGETLAILTNMIPKNKVLSNLTFHSMPTWGNNDQGSNLAYDVYLWHKNYETTVASDPLVSGEVKNHMDNASLDLYFGDSLPGGVRYLIVTRSSGPKSIGTWSSDGELHEANWRVFLNGKETKDGNQIPALSYTTGKVTYVETPSTPEPSSTPSDTPKPTAGESETPQNTPITVTVPETNEKPTGCGSTITLSLGITAVLLLAVPVLRKKSVKK